MAKFQNPLSPLTLLLKAITTCTRHICNSCEFGSARYHGNSRLELFSVQRVVPSSDKDVRSPKRRQ